MTKLALRLVRPAKTLIACAFYRPRAIQRLGCLGRETSTQTNYRKIDKREPLPYWMDVQADFRRCWSHRSDCRLCRAQAHNLQFYVILRN